MACSQTGLTIRLVVAVLRQRPDPVAHTCDSASSDRQCECITTCDDGKDSSDNYSDDGDGEMKSVFCGGHVLTVASDLVTHP